MTVGAILQTAATGISMMLVARIITGLGNGYVTTFDLAVFAHADTISVNTATSPVWQSETTKPSMRGKLIVFGMMYVVLIYSGKPRTYCVPLA